MTAAELIEELRNAPPDMPVWVMVRRDAEDVLRKPYRKRFEAFLSGVDVVFSKEALGRVVRLVADEAE